MSTPTNTETARCPNTHCTTNHPDRHPSHGTPKLRRFSVRCEPYLVCEACGWTNEPGVKTVGEWLSELGFEHAKYGRNVAGVSDFFARSYTRHPHLAACHYTEAHNQGNLQTLCGGEVILTFPKTTWAAERTNVTIAIVRDTEEHDHWLFLQRKGELTVDQKRAGCPYPKLKMVLMG